MEEVGLEIGDPEGGVADMAAGEGIEFGPEVVGG